MKRFELYQIPYPVQVLEMSGWVVGRTRETYVALFSARPTFWAAEDSPYKVTEFPKKGQLMYSRGGT